MDGTCIALKEAVGFSACILKGKFSTDRHYYMKQKNKKENMPESKQMGQKGKQRERERVLFNLQKSHQSNKCQKSIII